MEPSLIRIGNNVSISFQVCLCIHGKRQSHTPLIIEDGAYIGCRATVLSGKNGIKIGKNAVVGAMALVNKDIPDETTAVGIPVHIISKS